MDLRFVAAIGLVLASGGAAHAQDGARMAGLDLERPRATHRLPAALREVSGLAVTGDGRLFAHGDERAELFQLDPSTGAVVGRFTVGRRALRGDFEGLAIAGDRFFLVTSTGTIVEFAEGRAGGWVDHERHDTGLEGCEVEGLEHEPARGALVLFCKESDRGALVAHAFDLRNGTLRPTPRVQLAAAALGAHTPLHPSGVVRLPDGGLLVVAARQHALLELAPGGRVRAFRRLDGERHPQAEGIALLPDGSLAIADEGGDGRATLTVYGRVR